MSKKDFFSGHSKLYAAFRPTYPDPLYDFIFKHIKSFDTAWDCATGNGQVAQHLGKYFKKVYATDISQQQLDHAGPSDNIIYSVSNAEQTSFADQQFDLITVGQALHWFDVKKFYTEVRRVAKPDAVLAVWGYTVCSVNQFIDPYFYEFYRHTVGAYWDATRTLVEEKYQALPFPFKEIPAPEFTINVKWTREQFTGYISSWSATQKYIQANQTNPIPDLTNKLKPFWKENELKEITFPVFLRLGKIN